MTKKTKRSQKRMSRKIDYVNEYIRCPHLHCGKRINNNFILYHGHYATQHALNLHLLSVEHKCSHFYPGVICENCENYKELPVLNCLICEHFETKSYWTLKHHQKKQHPKHSSFITKPNETHEQKDAVSLSPEPMLLYDDAFIELLWNECSIDELLF